MRLIEKVWFHQHRARYWLVPLLLPLTAVFYVLSLLRRLAYRYRIFRSVKVNQPVIVVGNIGIGGNGKTPLVLWLIDLCQQQGLVPGVISRGYGGKPPQLPYLINDDSIVTQTGDEALMIYQRTHVAVCVGRDRIKSANKLIELGCNILITDDGLQHYRLQRDMEIVVVDGKRRFGNGLLLPAGPLREGLWRLKSVDYVVNNGNKPLLNETPMRLLPSKLINCLTGEIITIQDFECLNDRINAIAGIGSPERFFMTLTNIGFRLKNTQGFIDHHDYQVADFLHFDPTIPLLMTEKDAVKCYAFAQAHWWYLTVDAQIPKIQQREIAKHIIQLKAC